MELAEQKNKRRGREHPVVAINLRFREILLNLGFDEIINPIIVDEEDVYLQYGKEAPLILDRVYYLAGLDRADIGLSQERITKIRKIIPNFNQVDKLKLLLRQFKEGVIAADDFVQELSLALNIDEELTLKLIDNVFLELKELKPIPTKKTLRSHMTAAWYKTLSALQRKSSLPLYLFSIGPRFRREQRQDATHLFESTAASIVIMDDDFSMEDGKTLTRKILQELGFNEVEFYVKETTSNYYKKGTDTEVFVVHKDNKKEVANLGFYSEESLANYGIRHKVFNVGFGTERIAMLLYEEEDIRHLVYPQFVEITKEKITDAQIANSIRIDKTPTETGKELLTQLIKTCIDNKDKLGPVEILAYSGKFLNTDKKIKIWVYNWDEKKPLLSYAAMNEIYVHNGNIYALPSKLPENINTSKTPFELRCAHKEGINTKLRILDLLCNKFIYLLEKKIKTEINHITFELKFKILKGAKEANLYIPENILNFITAHNKKIAIMGPLFFGIKAETF